MEYVLCNLCGYASAKHWLTTVDRDTGEAFDIVRCPRCGLRYTSPRPSLDEIGAYYPEPRDLSRPAQIVRRWLHRRRARWCAAGMPSGLALDVGCGNGWMLHELWQAGWEVVGIERCERSAARPRRLGLDVYAGDLAECDLPAASFDLAILWHALEHLHNPLGTLTEVRRLLRLSGQLVIAVPNIDSWQARVAGRHWLHLDVPRHLHHFDPITLTTMLQRTGFRIQRCSWSSPAYEYRGWWDWVSLWGRSDAVACVLAGLLTPSVIGFSMLAAQGKAGAAMIVRAIPAADDI